MQPSILPCSQLRRYRSLRANGVPAIHAYRVATARPPSLRYRTGPGTTLHLEPDDPELDGFTINAVTEPDPDQDMSWLGEFTDTWSPNALDNSRDPRRYRYFVPTYTIAQRRADFSTRGYSRSDAQQLAEHAARKDLQLAHEIDNLIVTVSVRKAGVELGAAVLGADLAPDVNPDEQIISLIEEHGLIEEAVDAARTALPRLISALAA